MAIFYWFSDYSKYIGEIVPEIVKNENYQQKNYFLLCLSYSEPSCQKIGL